MPTTSDDGVLLTYELHEIEAIMAAIVAKHPELENYRPSCCNPWEDNLDPGVAMLAEELSSWRWLLTGERWPEPKETS